MLIEPQEIFKRFVGKQILFENKMQSKSRKANGTFLTNTLPTIDNIINIIDFDNILNKKILEPSCGHGLFLLRIIYKMYELKFSSQEIKKFISQNLIFNDIDPQMIEITKKNIMDLYKELFGTTIFEVFQGYVSDFTKKIIPPLDLFSDLHENNPLNIHAGTIDYVIGNPPYVTLYGRRDKKRNEAQRVYYLSNYEQFPNSIKNGKINYVMLFIENAISLLKQGGQLSFIIDISFFESAYLYTRKYLLENTKIESITYNITDFEVASGQLILKIINSKNINQDHKVKLVDRHTGDVYLKFQSDWSKKNDEYKFRLNNCEITDKIFEKIERKNDKTLHDLYPKKNLRTCVMLLNMEDKFVFPEMQNNNGRSIYPYYQGSKSLSEKFGHFYFNRYFDYNKPLQDKINAELKVELEKKGIKNKKRLGLGETIIYDNPKIYIRQSAKYIIASYDVNKSAANNSLYVFSLRKNGNDIRNELKFLCGLFNSSIITFFSQKKNIIRYYKGKQPQIKICDLYKILVPSDNKLKNAIINRVDEIYDIIIAKEDGVKKINKLIYDYYNLTSDEIEYVESSIIDF